jgi:hypothetical protein
MKAGWHGKRLQRWHQNRSCSLIDGRRDMRDSIYRRSWWNRHDDRFDLSGHHIENNAGFRIRAEQRARVCNQSFAGAVLLANMSVSIKNIIEEVRILELSELMAFVTVDPSDALASEFDCPERIRVRSANFLDCRGEFDFVFIPIPKDEMCWDRTEYADGLWGFDISTMENQLDVLLHKKANRFRDRLLSVVGVTHNTDPHGVPTEPVERITTPLTVTNCP